jgi:ElaB/YqjD/DUF883 family membrane-anchored ribosome-binding protein
MKGPKAKLAKAQYEAAQAKKRLASTLGALQYRLKPGTLMNHAWEGVRDKSSEMADDALAAVKERPRAASGVLATIVFFLARKPLGRAASKLFSRRKDEDDGVITADLDNHEDYDLTAPTVQRSINEGVNA